MSGNLLVVGSLLLGKHKERPILTYLLGTNIAFGYRVNLYKEIKMVASLMFTIRIDGMCSRV